MFHYEAVSKICPKKVLVTGGGGFIGSHFVEHILRTQPDVFVTVLDSVTYATSMETLQRFSMEPRVRFVEGDIRNKDTVEREIAGQETVFHFAAETHVPRSFGNSSLFFDTNVTGTCNLVNAALSVSDIRFVHMSTDEVYGPTSAFVAETADFNPTTPYADSKVQAEFEVRKAISRGLDAVIVRPTNAIGARQHIEKLAPRFVKLALEGKAFTIEGNGEQERCFVPACDLAEAVTLIEKNAERGAVYNVSGAELFTVLEFGKTVGEVLNIQTRFHYVRDRITNDASYRVSNRKIELLGYTQNSSVAQEIRNIAVGNLAAQKPRSVSPNTAMLNVVAS